jgi:hypothetical protein
MIGETIKELNTSDALAQFTPSPKTCPETSELANPTPMIEPIKVWELETGSPKYQVPTFQMIAEINSAKTMANPAPDPTLRTNSTVKNAIIQEATGPLEVSTPIRFHNPDHVTANQGLRL